MSRILSARRAPLPALAAPLPPPTPKPSAKAPKEVCPSAQQVASMSLARELHGGLRVSGVGSSADSPGLSGTVVGMTNDDVVVVLLDSDGDPRNFHLHLYPLDRRAHEPTCSPPR